MRSTGRNKELKCPSRSNEPFTNRFLCTRLFSVCLQLLYLRNQHRPSQCRGTEKAAFLQKGDGSFKAEIFVPVWSSLLFVSDWWQPEPVPLSVTVVPPGGAMASEGR